MAGLTVATPADVMLLFPFAVAVLFIPVTNPAKALLSLPTRVTLLLLVIWSRASWGDMRFGWP